MIRISPADVRAAPAFTPIHVADQAGLAVERMQGRLGHGDAVQLLLRGSAVRNYYQAILDVSCRRIANGQPRRSLSGYLDAIADPGGQLVTLEVREGNWVADDGIIQVLDASVGPGGPAVTELTLLFWPCHTLWFYGLGPDERQTVIP